MVDAFKHLHIVGIGGPGLNGMAHMLLDQGLDVTGCDHIRNTEIDALEKRGLIVAANHDLTHLKNVDALLVSAAIKAENVEIQGARQQGIPVLTRHDLWRKWSTERQVVAVCGSHGKTTSSGMLAYLLTQTGSNAGYLFGSTIPGLGSGRWGSGPLIIEADEYARTFLALSPVLSVITNIDPDHVEIYPTREVYEAAFREFVTNAQSNGGQIIACGDDPGVQRALRDLEFISYGIEQGNAWRATSIRWSESKLVFTVESYGTALADVACVGDVYGFRENDGQVNATDLVALIDGVYHKESVGDVTVAAENLLRTLETGDILVTMNAGNGSIVGTRVLTLLESIS